METEDLKVIENPILKAAKEYSVKEPNEYLKKFENMQMVRVLAGGSVEVSESEDKIAYGSPGYLGLEHGMAGGGIMRVAAATVISKSNSDLQVVVGGKYPKDEKKAPAEVIAAELQYAGVERNNIISDPNTLDTISEIIGLIKVAQLSDCTDVGVLTNEYHIPRIDAIINNLEWLIFDDERDPDFLEGMEKLRRGKININLIPAEDVIKNSLPAIYDSEIMPAIESVEMQRRIESEKHGVGDLKSGRYSRLIRGGLRVVLNRPEVDIVQS
ncbi:MAG: hypothetical protein US62_C0005G0045 [Candidatus Woesebacteria bacterium GW2011_GWA1_37_8]|uniref:DUF218 domain-containing protein n=2 Tax=Candidatus Woeseibacteriota TaxID=1752722 RepID=A0A0G0PBS7_9BACT|nr:MAG: hypothetical protein US39_C0005G0040 [Microgenomates group bacterium GW2011_GWC1_37_12b]KKQ46122.1 MAG: hypothetical protein US62_C0005G0045 [Candidatus Woesebacteria bacterium GW2011_GWA1_37_8]KKQ86731.1 MAG: hypothetical protein UT10_C0018G0043 [Candidatus Woesebacteria bacterium GW2011_GWB1_38_8b]